jgi:antitoxin component of RelBE/YafQ-DinJ toxin-antitoxin module
MTVQIEIDEKLWAEAEALAKDLQIDGSEIFQNTLQEVLRKLRLIEKDQKTIKSYRSFPQQPEEYEIWQDEQVWEEK